MTPGGTVHTTGRSLRPELFPSSHGMRLSVVLCVILACLLALSGQASAAKIYHPVASPFGALEAAGFSAVAVDNSTGASAGDIYITGPERTIYELQPDGTQVRKVEIPASDGERTQGIAVDDSNTSTAGDLYVVLRGAPPGGEPPGTPVPTHGAIYRLSPDGTLSPFVTGLEASPSTVAVGPSGEVFVVQSGEGGSWKGDVLEFSSSGAALNEGKSVIEDLEYPHGIAVDSHSDVYIANCAKGVGTVEFTPLLGGGYSAPKTIDPESGCLDSDLAVDSRTGYLFLANDNVVDVFDEDGTQIAMGSEEPGATSTYRYFAVADSEATGDIYAINTAAGFPTDATLQEAQPGGETPVVESEVLSNIPEGGATLQAQINPNGHETEYEFLLNGSQVGSGHIAASATGEAVSAEVSNLQAGSPYTFTVVARSSEGTTKGPERNFTAGSPPGPQSVTREASNISDTGATLNGTVHPDGAEPTITYFFEYGTSTSYGETTPVEEIGGRVSCGIICGGGNPNQDPAEVSANLTGLEPGVTYHYRLVATGPNGYRGYGKDVAFTPHAPAAEEAPSEVVTEPAERTFSGFNLNGELNPGNSPTSYYFEYIGDDEVECLDGLNNCWPQTAQAGPIAGDSQKHVAPIELTDLRLGETYRYRLVARNAKGTTRGNVLTFTTPSEGAPREVLVEPAEATATGYELRGKLNPENSPTTYYFIYKRAGEVECEDLEGCGPSTARQGPLSGNARQEVTAEVTGLEPETTYLFWMIAYNSNGTVRSNELTFKTPPSHARPLGGEEKLTSTEEKAPSSQTPTTGGGQSGASNSTASPSSTSGPNVPLLSPLVKPAEPKVLTRTQELARALKQCKKDKSKRARAACQKQAQRKYGSTTKKAQARSLTSH